MAGRTRTNVSTTINGDFQPQFERKEEQGANVLLVHLPGFAKEQISVTYVDSSRTIKVQGDRPLDKNRRSRFNQAFPVPPNCIIEKIQGNFRNGVLTITMPKQTIAQLSSVKDDANTAKETTAPKAISPQKEITTPHKAAASTSNSAGFEKRRDEKAVPAQTPQKAIITEPKAPKAPQIAPTPTTLAERQTNGNKADALQPSKQSEEKKTEIKDGELNNEVKEKVKKDYTVSESRDTPKIPEKERKDDKAAAAAGGGGGLVEDKKGKEGGRLMERANELKGMETIMKRVKRLATDDYEDRQLLLNIGVSVLVIVALGAYITYTYRSSGKPKR